MEKFQCECGSMLTQKYLSTHMKKDVHRRRINNILKCPYCKEEKVVDEYSQSGKWLSCNTCGKQRYENIGSIKVRCECGSEVVRKHLGKHKRSGLHDRRLALCNN